MNANLRARSLEECEEIVDALLAGAKKDGGGLCWPTTSDADDLTLWSGTPGVVLFLAEYFAATGDRRVLPAVADGLRWATREVAARPFAHGFYRGHGGLRFLARNVAAAMGEDSCRDLVKHLDQGLYAATEDARGTSCSLEMGIGGTLLGFPELSEINEAGRELARRYWRFVLTRARPTAAGVAWDEPRLRIKPGLGFCAGAAGLQWLMARACDESNASGVDWLVAASLRHDAAEGPPTDEGWPDFVHERYFADPANQTVLADAVARGHCAPLTARGWTHGWAAGTAGILLARLEVHAKLKRAAARDSLMCARGALERAAARCGEAADFSLAEGWGGIALVLRELDRIQPDFALPGPLQAMIEAALARRGAARSARAHGLSHGAAGVGYFLLHATSDASAPTLIAPPARLRAPAFGPGDIFQGLAQTRLPWTWRGRGRAPRANWPEILNLASFAAAADAALPTAEPVSHRMLAYEKQKLEALDGFGCTQYLQRRKAFLALRYRAEYSRLSDQELAGRSFALIGEAKVGRVEFPLPGNEHSDGGEGVLLLIENGVDGIVERRLSPFTYAVLDQLQSPARAEDIRADLRARHPVFARMESAALEAAILRVIRMGLEQGFVCEAAGLMAGWWGRLQGLVR